MNSLKHGLTGAGIVLPEKDVAEVHRRADAFAEELYAVGELEHALVRRLALHSLRMERSVDQQTAALSEHIRQVEADFVAPEGLDEAQVARLRAEAARRAMFDTSREATLARKYEAAAERGFYRAIKELREFRKPAKGLGPAADSEAFHKELGSILSKTTGQAGGLPRGIGFDFVERAPATPTSPRCSINWRPGTPIRPSRPRIGRLRCLRRPDSSPPGVLFRGALRDRQGSLSDGLTSKVRGDDQHHGRRWDSTPPDWRRSWIKAPLTACSRGLREAQSGIPIRSTPARRSFR